MGGKIGFIFSGLGLIVAIALYFLVPDTRGLSFDELDWLYNQGVSPRKFQKVIKDRAARGEDLLEANVDGKIVMTHLDHVRKGQESVLGKSAIER